MYKRMMWGVSALVVIFMLAGCASPEPLPERRAEPVVASDPGGVERMWPSGAPDLHARHAIMIEARTGRTIYQKFADSRVQVASTQKLVTALLLLERGNLDQRFVITRADCAVEPTKLGVRAGQTYSRRSLLNAMEFHQDGKHPEEALHDENT